MNHPVLWASPAPLWGRFGEADEAGAIVARFAAVDQRRPAILRFDSDDFMERLLAALAQSPRRIGELVARPETWRTPLAETPDLVERTPMPRRAKLLAKLRLGARASEAVEGVAHEVRTEVNAVPRMLPLKLFHPAHQRHYLVAANLVCARAGFPDRTVATGGREQVGLVVRRLLPPSPAIAGTDRVEFALVKDALGARWQRVVPAGSPASSERLVEGEELLPLFPMSFHDEGGQPRRLHAGVVPVGRREEYMTTRAQQVAAADTENAGVAATPSGIAARKEQFRLDVSEPWKALVRLVVQAAHRINEPGDGKTDGKQDEEVGRLHAQVQMQSWLTLLDFADYLKQHVRPVWDRIVTPSGPALTGGAKDLHDWLSGEATKPAAAWTGLAAEHSLTLAESLRRVVEARATLERTTASFPDLPGGDLAWPAFSVLLAGLRKSAGAWAAHGPHTTLSGLPIVPDPDDADPAAPAKPLALAEAEAEAAKVDKLVQLVMKAIDTARPAAPTPPLPFAAKLRDALATTGDDEGWFVMRFVYLRCDCGPLQPAVVSAPTARFQLAGFFDPDAPARPIRIALPLDTTPAGMRKFNKNAAFMISDVLCGQMQRAKGLGLVDLVRSVLPWPLHKDLDLAGMDSCRSAQGSIGMICSLSIPIVTICALILLMIIVSLLDFIFRWMPWFVTCLPIPGLKAKKP